MPKTISAYAAGLKVLESYGVKQAYGYPAGSVNSLMHALDQEKNHLKFIQVRHEQVAALAASANAKLTGTICVCFGSAGPGAANLVNGLYDAKADHSPVLALIGQVGNAAMNYDCFQEFPESPIFANIAQYDRIVMTPQSLPHVINEAVKQAYKNRGVSVVVVPNNFGYMQIPDLRYSTHSKSMDRPSVEPKATTEDVKNFLKMVKEAKRPVMHVGRGIHGNGDLVVKLSKKLQIPVCIDGLAKGLVDPHYEGYLGCANRAASKPADEAIPTSDLLIVIGGNFAFANFYSSYPYKYVQVDNDKSELGKHHRLDLGIWSDAGDFLKKALKMSTPAKPSPYFQALVKDNQNWHQYMHHIQTMSTKRLHTQQLYYWLNKTADPKTIYAIDTGNNIIDTFRYLNLYHHKWTISALYATMGYRLPATMAATLNYPKHPAIGLLGDGALSMVIQDLVTLHKYHLPVISIVTSNHDLGFIMGEQEDAPMKFFGLHLQDINFAGVAKNMGVDGVTIDKPSQIPGALKQAYASVRHGQPFLIDARVVDERALPVEDIRMGYKNGQLTETVAPTYRQDKENGGHYTLRQFFDEYDGQMLKPFAYFLKQTK
ncbi:pyruvate oxidase [Acetilactobacillus jinshanensis]|uniref:Pyruvate oxidase n=1 Tax=Acetilactobacillus jinshanensis TaxID=1720083 RepID=A0A4V1ALM5_9LACO|nr:pyruvate oxidase [Acetilactobacillus jinshanensis]QBP18119.1 pyruvate oxidase [Acetilactobacillus jinshanensis]URL60981.1 pyruvate oxidase [uncultured bacterium]